MNWEQIEGRWEQFKGQVREQWGKLTDSDIAVIGGKKDQLVGKLRTQYGLSKEQAEREIELFLSCRTEDLDADSEEHDVPSTSRSTPNSRSSVR